MESIEGGSSRRRPPLSDDKIDSLNLRDFLRVKDDDDDRRISLPGLTLGAVLSTEKRLDESPHLNRTLLDIIRDDHPNGGAFRDTKKSWKSFKDKLRLRRAGDGAAWTSTVHVPASDLPNVPIIHNINNNNNNNSRMISLRNSTRLSDDPVTESTRPELTSSSSSGGAIDSISAVNDRAMMLRRNSSRIPSLASILEGRLLDHSINSSDNNVAAVELPDLRRQVQFTEEEETEEGVGETAEEEEGGEGGEEPPLRMSLMALLAETDREMGIDGSAYMMIDDEDEEEEEEEVEESGEVGVGVRVEVGVGVGEYNNCCVCMVRDKGSAFIPCGHTFCRLCSRELWVQRGNCPLCNGFILEILDIF